MCIACYLGLHEECNEPIELDSENSDAASSERLYQCCCYGGASDSGSEAPLVSERVILPQGANKQDSDVSDRTSTGRKRAAKLKPIIVGMVCEWAGLLYAGGGAHPIVGCGGTILADSKGQGGESGNIHHGPDKDTLNNSDENLHRVCGYCHNRWHTLNDPLYPKERPDGPFLPVKGECLPHDKFTRATPEQLQWSETWWKLDKAVRANVPYRKEN